MDIKNTPPAELIKTVELIEDIEVLRSTATELELTFSGNTGVDTLKKKIIDYLESLKTPETPVNDVADILGGDEEEEIEVAKPIPAGPSIDELLEMDPKNEKDATLRRKIIRAKSMALKRVQITNLDPSEAQLEGAIVTVTNKYTGKVSKFVPFGDANENGWHVPVILLNFLKNQKFVLRREVKGGKFGVKKYKTSLVNKYQIVEMDPLSKEEIAELAAHQRASGTIDKQG